jgi:hypothetical protein
MVNKMHKFLLILIVSLIGYGCSKPTQSNASYSYTNNVVNEVSASDPKQRKVSAIEVKEKRHEVPFFSFDSTDELGHILDAIRVGYTTKLSTPSKPSLLKNIKQLQWLKENYQVRNLMNRFGDNIVAIEITSNFDQEFERDFALFLNKKSDAVVNDTVQCNSSSYPSFATLKRKAEDTIVAVRVSSISECSPLTSRNSKNAVRISLFKLNVARKSSLKNYNFYAYKSLMNANTLPSLSIKLVDFNEKLISYEKIRSYDILSNGGLNGRYLVVPYDQGFLADNGFLPWSHLGVGNVYKDVQIAKSRSFIILVGLSDSEIDNLRNINLSISN